MQLIEFFKTNRYEVHFSTPCSKSENAYPLEKIGIATQAIEVNNSDFDIYLKEINPSIVIFDRFMMEEQFGWRVQEVCPETITILDTEDLHSLRKKRKSKITGKPSSKNEELELRELASIFRCDISLIISRFEIEYLMNEKGIKEAQLLYLPFMEDFSTETNLPDYHQRENFITIGSFLHDPNVDGVRFLKQKIWPLIRKKLPGVEMHVYGSYPNSKVEQLTNKQEGFIIKGWAEDAEAVMKNAKVCLSPLRFGAGLKGKFIDAMKYGTPSITTSIGAEGMATKNDWPGYISDSSNELANKAIKLYSEEKIWAEKQAVGFQVLRTEFSKDELHQVLKNKLFDLKSRLAQHRSENIIGNILKLNTLRSTKYMSKWIEEKNKDN